MEKYILESQSPLGEGSFGTVFRAIDQRTGGIVAIKTMKFDIFAEGIPGAAIREISNMQELNHKRIAKLKEIMYGETGTMHIVMEHLDLDLRKYLTIVRKNNEAPKLPEHLIKRFTRHLLKGVAYCHAHRIMHRDLKPGNLLIDSNFCLKIADFGLSRAHSLPAQRVPYDISTLWYRPPEVLLGEQCYTGSYDMWSVGCIIAEMARMGNPLFRGRSDLNQLHRIFRVLGTPDDTIWPGVSDLGGWNEDDFPKFEAQNMPHLMPGITEQGVDLVMQCLLYPPSFRISARRALLHPWINKNLPEVFSETLASFYIGSM